MSDDPRDPDAARTRLTALREALTAGEIARDAMGKTVELDQTRTGRLSRMDALQAQAMAKASQQRARIQLKRIDAAIARVEAGSYGDCAACGERIADARLEADPATPFCRDCAEAREA